MFCFVFKPIKTSHKNNFVFDIECHAVMFYFILLIYFKTMNKYESAIEHLNIQNMQNVSKTFFF